MQVPLAQQLATASSAFAIDLKAYVAERQADEDAVLCALAEEERAHLEAEPVASMSRTRRGPAPRVMFVSPEVSDTSDDGCVPLRVASLSACSCMRTLMQAGSARP